MGRLAQDLVCDTGVQVVGEVAAHGPLVLNHQCSCHPLGELRDVRPVGAGEVGGSATQAGPGSLTWAR